MAANSTPGDVVIKVVKAEYSQAHETTYFGGGYPLVITNPSVRIEGTGSVSADYPTLGGDVNEADSSVRALFDIVVDSEETETLRFERLWFSGEDVSGRDAPGAVRVEVKGGGTASVVLDGCRIERLEMNDSSNDDRPSILGVGGYGALSLEVRACDIVPTRRGGVQMIAGDDCLDTGSASNQTLEVDSCSFILDGTLAADAAINVLYEVHAIDRTVTLICTLSDNVIDSRSVTGQAAGFASGIRYGGSTDGGSASVQINHDSRVERNVVTGCSSEGMLFVGERLDEGDDVNVQCWYVARNVVHDNFGDGLVFDAADTGPYMRFMTHSNLVFGNRNGIIVRNTEEQENGNFHFTNDTIADSEHFGFIGSGLQISHVLNTINWGNGCGSWSGLGGWTPADVPIDFWRSNNWEGETGAFDPEFVDAENADYHLTSGSDCRNAGVNGLSGGSLPALLSGPDVYGGRRVAETTIDIGADEYDPNE